jgi:hypothetical protein
MHFYWISWSWNFSGPLPHLFNMLLIMNICTVTSVKQAPLCYSFLINNLIFCYMSFCTVLLMCNFGYQNSVSPCVQLLIIPHPVPMQWGHVDSIGFWRWCITHRITGVSDFIHCPDFNNYKKKETNTTFRKLDLFPSSGEGRHLFCWIL